MSTPCSQTLALTAWVSMSGVVASPLLTSPDIDWEYPGGNGADYKQVSNSAKSYQIEAFPKLLAATRTAIGPNKLLSIAVPGKKGRYCRTIPQKLTDETR